MKTYRIVLFDRINRAINDVERFTGEVADLKNRLRELQLGYCEGERPTVSEIEIKSNGGVIRTLVAESDCDFCYMSPIAKV